MQMWRKNRIYHEHDEFQRNFPIQIQAQAPTQPNYSWIANYIPLPCLQQQCDETKCSALLAIIFPFGKLFNVQCWGYKSVFEHFRGRLPKIHDPKTAQIYWRYWKLIYYLIHWLNQWHHIIGKNFHVPTIRSCCLCVDVWFWLYIVTQFHLTFGIKSAFN